MPEAPNIKVNIDDIKISPILPVSKLCRKNIKHTPVRIPKIKIGIITPCKLATAVGINL